MSDETPTIPPAPPRCTKCGSGHTDALLAPGLIVDPSIRYCEECWSVYRAALLPPEDT